MLQDKYSIIFVDDHPIVLEGLAKLLAREESFLICGSFSDGTSALDFIKEQPVDVVLLDVTLQDLSGMDICRSIKSIRPSTTVLALSNHNERSAITKMLDSGASGYILKSALPAEIISCIKETLSGRLAFSREVQDIIAMPEAAPAPAAVYLTAREKEILQLIATGSTTTQMAKTLFLSKFTVENHRKSLLQKLKVNNVAALIAEAARQGLI